MPDRIIRDEILTSERYWAISSEARTFYIHILLNADDTARFSGKNYTLRAACYPGFPINPERIEAMLLELVDQDLIRLYEVHQERFIFVPRFRQRLRYVKSKYPEPPSHINDLTIEKTDSSKTPVEPKLQKRSEEKRSEEKKTSCSSHDERFHVFWSMYPRKVGKGAAEKSWQRIPASEHSAVMEGLGRAKTSKDWQKDGGQFIPNPATWLNQKRWQDEPDPVPAKRWM